MNARQAAFFALLRAEKNEAYIEETLQQYGDKPEEHALAYELASGALRLKRLLDHQALQHCKKLPAKLKEKICLRLALYQIYFLSRIPLHAALFESVELAKQECGPTFAKFLNAILRKCDRSLPIESTNLAIQHSYSDYFVESLIKKYGEEKTAEILRAGNRKPALFARKRPSCEFEEVKGNLSALIQSPHHYIQNPSQAALISKLASGNPHPASILDLCAAPGGKILLMHDLFPKAKLFANDISEKRLSRLKENLLKYTVEAELSCQDAAHFASHTQFDLVVVDAPCSNSGVLYKCPEARFRIEKEEIATIQKLQREILSNALKLVGPGGQLWYLTCSILPQENEEVVLALYPQAELFSQLPTLDGLEGGFAARIQL